MPRARVTIPWFVVGMLTLLVACGSEDTTPIADSDSVSAEGVSFTADQSHYAPGDEVTVSLTNGSPRRIGYNFCAPPVELEAREEKGWHRVAADLGPPGANICLTVRYLLAPGDRADETLRLPEDLLRGTYRLSYEAHIGGARVKVSTESFEVEG